MLHVIFDEGLADARFLAEHSEAPTRSRDMARPFAPEDTAARTGVPAETVRDLARDLAAPGRPRPTAARAPAWGASARSSRS